MNTRASRTMNRAKNTAVVVESRAVVPASC